MIPFENHVLSHDEMEIPCRVTDPSASVSLIHIETNQVLPSVYDSKRGFVGLFSAGTYVCRALIKGQMNDSIQYIVHGWTGQFILQFKKIDIFLIQVISLEKQNWIRGIF